jgi:hypothetical protein
MAVAQSNSSAVASATRKGEVVSDFLSIRQPTTPLSEDYERYCYARLGSLVENISQADCLDAFNRL